MALRNRRDKDAARHDAVLEGLLDAARVHVFDVDHTLTRHATGRRFARAGINEGYLRLRDFWSLPWYYLRYRLGNLGIADVTREMRPLRGLSRTLVKELAEIAWWGYTRYDLFPRAARHIAACTERNHTVILLSTSFELLLNPLGRHLAVDAVIASRLAFEEGIATGWIAGTPCYADEKRRRLHAYLQEHALDGEPCAFYSDSFHDLPTFTSVTHPVAIHPDAALRRHATRHGWPIVRW